MTNRQTTLILAVAIAITMIVAVAALRATKTDRSEDRFAASPVTPELDDAVAFEEVVSEPKRLAEILESLNTTLNEEIQERHLLTQQVEQMQADMNRLLGRMDGRQDRGSSSRTAVTVSPTERFVEMGFTDDEREAINRLQASTQFLSVELDDRARREGWYGTQRYAEEMQALTTYNNPVRQNLGDDRYDRYLFAQGMPNRIVIGNVMEASQAQKSGLRSGDVIVRYGGQLVFSNTELSNLRSSGTAGEPVIVDINRNGQAMQITMPRGPMGIGGREHNVDPRTNTPLQE